MDLLFIVAKQLMYLINQSHTGIFYLLYIVHVWGCLACFNWQRASAISSGVHVYHSVESTPYQSYYQSYQRKLIKSRYLAAKYIVI